MREFSIVTPEFNSYEVNLTKTDLIPNLSDINTSKHNAACINKAIEEISVSGGGTLNIPDGMWITGPIRLLSNVNLHLNRQTVLKFSKNSEEYPLIITNYEGQECIRTVSPISANNAVNIAITGNGVIDGSGDEWRPIKEFKLTNRAWNALFEKSEYVLDTKEGGVWFPTKSSFEGNRLNIQKGYEGKSDDEVLELAKPYYDFYRPVLISLKHCDKVLLEGVTFKNSPAWNIHPFFCTNLTVRNINVNNAYHAQNGDGIDIESCNGVEIYNSRFETGDDAICVKSGKNAVARTIKGPCENVYIHDCLVNEGHGGFVIGSEMSRGVKNVYVKDCLFLGTDVGIRMKSALGRGGVVENIHIENVNMMNIINEGIIMTMSYVLNSLNRNEVIAKENEEDIPFFKNITIDKVNCVGAKHAIKIEPLVGREDTISDITITNSTFENCGESVIKGVNINIEK
ncbi:glycoside hydrolase family 28 protein [Lachnospira multipara]|uniref:glycoside hydrolase family 28 protein n=1 Tax=Lachnospira multipara TaxID=28051 RepID=UPI000684E543|nr:glycoside hydrolase family 28 protein [Lachnospira multipara]